MVLPIADTGERGNICEGVGYFLHSGRSGDPVIRGSFVGQDPLHGAEPGGVPPPGDKADHG